MIGTYAVGNQSYQMNLTPSTQFKVQDSKETESYYPQMTYFANHANDMVKQDSLKSVTTQTFIVGDGSVNNPYIIRNESDWLALADSTTSGNDYKNKFFEMAAGVSTLNFDAQTSIYAFKPVGTNGKPFNGILDGNGKTLSSHRIKMNLIKRSLVILEKMVFLRHVSVS